MKIAPVMPTYARTGAGFVSGEGAWLTTAGGERYLDFGAGIAVVSLGHCHPHLVAALREQAGLLWHTSNLYPIPGQTRLAERLVAATFADTVFFTNSGVEAMECAVKMARRHHHAKGTGRDRIITFEGSFHGRSLGMISAAGSEKLVKGFGPLLDGFDILPFGDHDALEAAVGDRTAAILVEPVQGEGGIRPLPAACLKGLRALCDRHGLLLILDEIQCGVGRTGTLFAHDAAGIRPDIMAVAKGIGGGFPLGCCLATAEAAGAMTSGSHGTTYGGNPLAMAVGNAVLDVVLADGFLEGVRAKGERLRAVLEDLAADRPDRIGRVRGAGLMLGLQLAKGTPAELVAAAEAERLLLVPAADDTVRVLPPLTLTEDDIDEGGRRLARALERLGA